MSRFDPEEDAILEVFEKGELNRTANASQEIELHKAIAEATFKQEVRLNVHLSSRDFRLLQARTLQEAIPYAAFISSVLPKFAAGQLVDKAANP